MLVPLYSYRAYLIVMARLGPVRTIAEEDVLALLHSPPVGLSAPFTR